MENNSGKWAAIINPISGGGRCREEWPRIEQLLLDKGIVPECLFTEHRYHAVELAVEAVSRGFRKLIAVGGDGTFHEVANGVFIQKEVPTQDILLGVVSLGTGNDWGRTYGFPSDYPGIVEAIAAERSVLQDAGHVNYSDSNYRQGRYFVNVSGMGFDSNVIERYDKLKENGRTGKVLYIWSLLKALVGYRSAPMNIRVDGEQVAVNERIFTAAVGIGRYNGGGMMQLPLAAPDDGLFDLTVIRKIRKLKVMRKLRTLFNGTVYSIREVSHHRGRTIRIEAPGHILAEADGELLGNSPFEYTLIPGAIRVVVPEGLRKTP